MSHQLIIDGGLERMMGWECNCIKQPGASFLFDYMAVNKIRLDNIKTGRQRRPFHTTLGFSLSVLIMLIAFILLLLQDIHGMHFLGFTVYSAVFLAGRPCYFCFSRDAAFTSPINKASLVTSLD
jgi:hypothetical protein